jgi:hypothetical protein
LPPFYHCIHVRKRCSERPADVFPVEEFSQPLAPSAFRTYEQGDIGDPVELGRRCRYRSIPDLPVLPRRLRPLRPAPAPLLRSSTSRPTPGKYLIPERASCPWQNAEPRLVRAAGGLIVAKERR